MTGPMKKKTSKITTLRGTLFATAAATVHWAVAIRFAASQSTVSTSATIG